MPHADVEGSRCALQDVPKSWVMAAIIGALRSRTLRRNCQTCIEREDNISYALEPWRPS